MPESRQKLMLALLLVSALSLFFVDLGGSSIWDANEAFYVETPREMMERGDYVFPTFNYEPRVNKPVLSYWIVAGFYKLFGVSVAVQRIPIAIGGVLIVLMTFHLGRLAAGSNAAMAGLWAAIGMAASPRLMMFSRRIFIDIYITLFMVATLLFFALAERFPARRRLFLCLMYVSVGLGVLTKGPVAIALPGLVFGIYLLAHGELRRVTKMMIPAGMLIVLAIVVPWYAALYQRDGWTHIASFFFGENIGRYTEGIGYDTDRGPFFYLGVIFSDGLPWALMLFSAFVLWLRARTASEPDSAHRVQTLFFIWIAVIAGFFSFSASKQDLYIYPVMPAIAALGGAAIAAAAPGTRWASTALGLLLALAGAGILYVFNASGNVYALEGIPAVAVVAIGGGVVALVLATRGQWRSGLLAFVTAGVLLNWILVIKVLPSFEPYKPVPRLTEFLQPRVAPDDVIAHYSVALPSMVYYMRRHIDVTYDLATFLQMLRQPRRVYGILWTEEYERLKGEIGVPTCALHQVPSFNVKIGAMIERKPLPHLVVITNRCDPDAVTQSSPK